MQVRHRRPDFRFPKLIPVLVTAGCAVSLSHAGRQIDPNEPPPVSREQLIAANDTKTAAAPLEAAEATLLPPTETVENRPTPSQNVTINLINRLVARGLLPKEDADELIKQAEADASVARAQAAVDSNATVQAAVSQAVAAVRAEQ